MNVFVIVAAVAAAVVVQANNHELLFVTFVHRHGDRSPVGTYPNDPYGNESLWNNGWGELTNTGKQKAYELGKWMRERYADFLPKEYSKKDYEAQSTDISRTLMSAYLVLAGLYEPTGSDVWHPAINWQPIPVHTSPVAFDKVLSMGKSCPRHRKMLLQLMVSKQIVSQLNPIAEAVSEVVTHAGYESKNVLTDLVTAGMVYDSLRVQSQNGLELPTWSKRYYPQPLQDMASLILRLSAFNESLQRLSCGPLVQDILEHLKSKITGGLSQKMWQYSAHDTTIVGLAQCLGLKMDPPPYASALILELARGRSHYLVRVLYKVENTLKTLVVPGCTEFCPLFKFEELVSPVIPENWEEECES